MNDLLPAISLFFLFAATPGVNNALLTGMGAAYGFARVQRFILGVMIGVAIVFVFSSFGLGALLLAQPYLLKILRGCGVALLLYLAWKILTAPMPTAQQEKPAVLGITEGIAVQLVNPKLWSGIFGINAILPATASTAELAWQTLLLTTGCLLVTIVSLETWGYFGSLLTRMINTQRAHRIVCFINALLLVLIALGIAFDVF